MSEELRFIFFVVIITCIVIPMIESAKVDDTNTISILDLDQITGSHVDICCPEVLFLDYAYIA